MKETKSLIVPEQHEEEILLFDLQIPSQAMQESSETKILQKLHVLLYISNVVMQIIDAILETKLPFHSFVYQN